MKRGQAGLQLLLDLGQLFVAMLRMQLLEDAQDAIDHHPLLQGRGIAAVDIRAAADDHRGAVLQLSGIAVARVGQRFLGGPQRHEMVRLGRHRRHWA